jgi:hypothetical protein
MLDRLQDLIKSSPNQKFIIGKTGVSEEALRVYLVKQVCAALAEQLQVASAGISCLSA